jgi:3-hydroxyacyl-[acyl-carrier-protein] dehydratase
MILEALAQTAGILCFVTANVIPDHKAPLYFVGIDKARFRRPVVPGDQLLLTAQLERSLRGIWRFSTAALVGEQEVAHADMMVAPETGK